MHVAVELRHHSWAVDPVFDLMSRHHATYVVMSGAGLPCVLRATSTTVYVRLHGPDHDHLYAGLYGDADLYWWADRIREWHRQHLGVFAYGGSAEAGSCGAGMACFGAAGHDVLPSVRG